MLIGTRSIDKSEILSRLLTERGIEHQVLNANHIAAEAEIVAQAGAQGRVTVSTNMAGRGTDIKLGPGVVDLGGLHVILTEMHDAARIDRQLSGRCGRQGDPGTYRQYLALDDDLLLAGLGPKKSDRLKAYGERATGSLDRLSYLFRRAQRRVEARHFRQRRALMYFEKERKKMQQQMGQDPVSGHAGGVDMPRAAGSDKREAERGRQVSFSSQIISAGKSSFLITCIDRKRCCGSSRSGTKPCLR